MHYIYIDTEECVVNISVSPKKKILPLVYHTQSNVFSLRFTVS